MECQWLYGGFFRLAMACISFGGLTKQVCWRRLSSTESAGVGQKRRAAAYRPTGHGRAGWEPDTSATRHFGTNFKPNHRWSCVLSELSWVQSVHRLFVDLMPKCLVPRFLAQKCLETVLKCLMRVRIVLCGRVKNILMGGIACSSTVVIGLKQIHLSVWLSCYVDDVTIFISTNVPLTELSQWQNAL